MTDKSTKGNESNTNDQGVEHVGLEPGAVVPGIRMVPIEGDVVHGKQAYRAEISRDEVEEMFRQTKACMDAGIERCKASFATLDIAPELRDLLKAGIDQAYADAKAKIAGRAS